MAENKKTPPGIAVPGIAMDGFSNIGNLNPILGFSGMGNLTPPPTPRQGAQAASTPLVTVKVTPLILPKK